MTAKEFIDTLNMVRHENLGAVSMKVMFSLSKAFQHMPLLEVIKLLNDENENHRIGAVSILDWKARNKKTSTIEKEEVYKAYVENHKWIDSWGMVDRAAPYVVGGYLYDKDRTPLYTLAKSKNPMERRTAIVSTYYFIRKNEIEDTFNIAELLVHDKNEYVQKAVGSWIREAGKRDESRLKGYLAKYAKTMPRVTLRYAIEKLSAEERKYYMNLKKDKTE